MKKRSLVTLLPIRMFTDFTRSATIFRACPAHSILPTSLTCCMYLVHSIEWMCLGLRSCGGPVVRVQQRARSASNIDAVLDGVVASRLALLSELSTAGYTYRVLRPMPTNNALGICLCRSTSVRARMKGAESTAPLIEFQHRTSSWS